MGIIARWFRIDDEERPLIIALCGSGFFLSAAFSVLSSLLLAFVMTRIGIARLSTFFIIDAAALLVGSWASIRLFRRTRSAGQVLGFAAFATIATLLLAALRHTDAVGHSTMLALATLGSLASSGGISVAVDKLRTIEAEAFNLEQLTRLDPLLTSAVTLGTAAGGALLVVLAGNTDAPGLFFLVPTLMLAASPFCLRVARLTAGDAWQEAASDEFRDARERDVAGMRFVMMIAVVAGMSTAFGRLFQFSFAAATSARFADEAALSGFIGAYMAVLSIVSAVMVNTVHRFALRRFGLTNALFITPAIIGIGVLAMAFEPSLVFVVGAVFVRDAFVPLQEVATRGMLEGMRDDRRSTVLSWLNGPVMVVGGLLGALLTAIVSSAAGAHGTASLIRAFAAVILALLAVRFGVNVAVRRRYPWMLLESLQRGDYKTRVRAMEALAEYRFLDDRRMGVVLDVLCDEAEPPALRTQALRTLAVVQDHATLRVIGRFIGHSNTDIRLEAVRAIAAFRYPPEGLYASGFSRKSLVDGLRRSFGSETSTETTNAILVALVALRDPDIVDFLADALRSPFPHVRQGALRSMRTFTDPMIIDHVKPFLIDPSPALRAQGIAVLWQFPWERHGTLTAQLDLLLSAPTGSEELRQGLYLVGTLRLRDRRDRAIEALTSPDAATKRVAAIALLKQGDEAGIPVLTDILRGGTKAEAFEVERLSGHPEIQPRQRERLRGLLHQHHLHYPPGLPVSEPLRVRLAEIPRECIPSLRAHYTTAADAGELRKLDSPSTGTSDRVRGKVFLAALPTHWRDMASVALLAHGWQVRVGASLVEASPDERTVSIDAQASTADLVLTEKTMHLSPTEIAMSHFAPSALLAALERIEAV